MGEKPMFIRVCEGLNDIGKLVPINDYTSYIKDLNKDHYTSIYHYTESHKKQADEIIEIERDGKKIKRPRGVSGITDVTTNKLVWDFDSSSLEDARKDCLELVNRLEAKGIVSDNINICFSGNKGFAVEVNSTDTFNPSEFKNIVTALASDLKTFDPKVVNPSRIFRVPFTKHITSGLYKTPLYKEELQNLSIEGIKELSKTSSKIDVEYLTHKSIIPMSIKMLKIAKKEVKKKVEMQVSDLDLKNKPEWLSNWKFALSRGLFKEGTRSFALTILAATCRAQNLSKIQTYYFLKAAADEQSDRYGSEKFSKDEIWKNIIEVVFGQNWQGGSWSEEHFPDDIKQHLLDLGIPRGNVVEDKGLESVSDISGVFTDYAENIDKNTIKTGIPGLDGIVRITTSMMVGLLGAPAGGKSATILNILRNMSLSGESSVFFSLDMGRPLIFQKMVQQLTGFDSDYLFKIYQQKNEEKKQFIQKTIEHNYQNVQLCFKTGATVEDLKKYIIDHEQTTGKKVRLVAVDYLEKVLGPYSDATANSGYVAAKLQELANDLRLCVILLLQPQKMVGVPSDPILSYRNIKGASVIEQDCRIVLSLWREGYNPQSYENDKFITYAVLKNTMGQLGQVECGWDGLKGEVFELDDMEKVELKELKKLKSQQKAIKEDW